MRKLPDFSKTVTSSTGWLMETEQVAGYIVHIKFTRNQLAWDATVAFQKTDSGFRSGMLQIL